MADSRLWAHKNRSVLRTLICADFVVAPESTKGPRGTKAQISLTVWAHRDIVRRRPPGSRHDLLLGPFWHDGRTSSQAICKLTRWADLRRIRRLSACARQAGVGQASAVDRHTAARYVQADAIGADRDGRQRSARGASALHVHEWRRPTRHVVRGHRCAAAHRRRSGRRHLPRRSASCRQRARTSARRGDAVQHIAPSKGAAKT